MKKIIVLLLVAVMMFSTTAMVFAEETTPEVKVERTERTKEEKRASVTDLFETYFPEGLEAFNQVTTAHQTFHETTRTERDLLKAEITAERDAFKESIKAGDMTREEAKALLEEKKSVHLAVKAEIAAIKELKQADVAANKVEMKAVRESLKVALQSEEVDATLVASLLNQVTELMNDHLDIDYLYYDMIHNLLNTEDEII